MDAEAHDEMWTKLKAGVEAMRLELRYWLHKWHEARWLFAIVFDHRLGPEFLRLLIVSMTLLVH